MTTQRSKLNICRGPAAVGGKNRKRGKYGIATLIRYCRENSIQTLSEKMWRIVGI